MKRRKSLPKRVPHFFSKFVVISCVFSAIIFSGLAFLVMWKTKEDTSQVLSACLLFFGGELALIFGRDAIKRGK